MTGFVALHIAGGSVAIFSGYAALFAPKGKWLHRRAGMLFVAAMIVMGLGATVVGLSRGLATWTGGPSVFYLVVSALTTVRPRTEFLRRVDIALLTIPLSLGITRLISGVQVTASPTGMFQGVPGPVIMATSMVLLIAAAGDIKMLRRGALHGVQRLRRHLWRMCYATFVATGSFFLGQPKFIPAVINNMPTRITLAVAPLVLLFYWMWRVRSRRSNSLLQETPMRAALEV